MLKTKKTMEVSDSPKAQPTGSTPRKPLRLWPGVVIAVVQGLAWLSPMVVPEPIGKYLRVFGGFIGGLLVVVWWIFFSRAHWSERLGAIVLMVVAVVATPPLLHESVAKGNFGMQFFIYAIPALTLTLVVSAVVSRRLPYGLRLATMIASILLAGGVWTLVRSKGLSGEGWPIFAWRWTATAEEHLLNRSGDELEVSEPPPVPVVTVPGIAWPGFRGPDRDGIIPGVRIETDWAESPPVELWRRPIGPGISSFAVQGRLLYTQEQRGENEVVSCYNLTDGQPVWAHYDQARHWDSHVGAGPRATPALSDGRVYTFGATGILNALDAYDGEVVWSRNAASDADKRVPYFGFTNSPLVVDDLVVVAVSGTLVAYDLVTGEPRWFGPDRDWTPSSPHLLTLDGVAQILLLNGAGVTSVAPADGTLLWEHAWPGDLYLQPALIPNSGNDVLVSASDDVGGIGIRRITVAHEPDGWSVEQRWTSRGLKPYINDFVVHEGHAYGFDGRILACIDLEDGKRKWKGGRYGYGQLILLADQDLLLVVSEKGKLALIESTPDRFTELARFPAIEGKTWSHPALVRDLLLVRNGQEMAAFRLPSP